MIEVKNLSKSYGRINAVKNISFTVEKGEILGFLGPNGAGKSTTMNIITGYIPSTEGTVTVGGFEVLENEKEVKKRIGYLPENPPLYVDMTVEEYLKFVGQLKQLPKKEIAAGVNDVIEVIKLGDVRKRLIKNLSKGYRQRVGLAQALLGNPEVLILDEPTVGLDPKQIIEIRNLIKFLGKQRTIILSSHILPEVNAVCDRVVIINRGEIVAIDTPQNLSNRLTGAGILNAKIEGTVERIREIINAIEGVKGLETNLNKQDSSVECIIECEESKDIRKTLFFAMAEAGMPILELKPHRLSLEEVFLQLTTTEENNMVEV